MFDSQALLSLDEKIFRGMIYQHTVRADAMTYLRRGMFRLIVSIVNVCCGPCEQHTAVRTNNQGTSFGLRC